MDIVAKQWKQQLQYLLEGRDYESLIFASAEDIPILPFYTAENVKSPYVINTKTQVAVPLFISDKEATLKRIAFWKEQLVSFFLLDIHPKLTQKEVEKFLISYFTKKELGENDERYKSYVTTGLYDKLTELEKKSSQQAYKGYYVNYTYESSDIYINNKKNTALVVVNYLYDSKKTLDSKELAQKGITAKATYKLTYSNSDGKFLVSDIVSQNIVDGDNLMLDTGFIQDEQTEKPDQTGQTEEQHE